jgi:hypothetical protein
VALKRVQPGQPIQLQAEAWNAFIDAAVAFQSSGETSGSSGTGSMFRPTDLVTVQNMTGVDRDRFSVVALNDVIIQPTIDTANDNAAEFLTRIALKGSAVNDFERVWGILQEPIQNGALGKCRIVGCSFAWIDIEKEAHRWAATLSGSRYLTSCASAIGGAQIMWVAGGVGSATNTGQQWSIVRIGNVGASQMCLVQQNGVDANGDPKYDIFDLDDTDHESPLNDDPVVPENYRSADVFYTAGNSGIFEMDRQGNTFLFVFDEVVNC